MFPKISIVGVRIEACTWQERIWWRGSNPAWSYAFTFTFFDRAFKVNKDKQIQHKQVDCRDDDVKGGKIVGSLHLPDSEFDIKSIETIMKEVESKKDKDVDVVYCMDPLEEGPDVQGDFMRRWNCGTNHDSNITIRVLIGGFDQWIKNFYGTDMIEDLWHHYWGLRRRGVCGKKSFTRTMSDLRISRRHRGVKLDLVFEKTRSKYSSVLIYIK